MNNTALRAGAQSANNKHMVFYDEEYEKFYYEKLEQVRHRKPVLLSQKSNHSWKTR